MNMLIAKNVEVDALLQDLRIRSGKLAVSGLRRTRQKCSKKVRHTLTCGTGLRHPAGFNNTEYPENWFTVVRAGDAALMRAAITRTFRSAATESRFYGRWQAHREGGGRQFGVVNIRRGFNRVIRLGKGRK